MPGKSTSAEEIRLAKEWYNDDDEAPATIAKRLKRDKSTITRLFAAAASAAPTSAPLAPQVLLPLAPAAPPAVLPAAPPAPGPLEQAPAAGPPLAGAAAHLHCNVDGHFEHVGDAQAGRYCLYTLLEVAVAGMKKPDEVGREGFDAAVRRAYAAVFVAGHGCHGGPAHDCVGRELHHNSVLYDRRKAHLHLAAEFPQSTGGSEWRGTCGRWRS